jgi:hypothetical protein
MSISVSDKFSPAVSEPSLYRAGSLTAAARELARYKLDLLDVQEVMWDKGGRVRAGDYNFFYGKGNWEQNFLYITK